jgi:hypothetical protein
MLGIEERLVVDLKLPPYIPQAGTHLLAPAQHSGVRHLEPGPQETDEEQAAALPQSKSFKSRPQIGLPSRLL